MQGDRHEPGALRLLRAAARAAALLAVVAVLLPPAVATRLLGAASRSGRAMGWSARLQSWWARASLRIAGVRVTAHGLDRIPRGGCLVCANHRGYLDVLVLAACVPGRFVAMHELRGWPLFGWMARSAGTLFLRRERTRDLPAANAAVARTLAAGIPVILFPEARAGSGAGLAPLRSPLFESAVQSGVPCVAVALSYATPGVPWSTAWTVSWWGGMDLRRHAARLLALPRIEARLAVAGDPVSAQDRKTLSDLVRARLLSELPSVALDPAPPDNPWAVMEAEA